MLAPLYDGDLAALRRFDCAAVNVASVPCVVSNTGWSKEAGYEIYPLGSERCVELWDAIVAAGEPHGLLVTGPNITRAVEQGITDTQYHVNSGMTALEAGPRADAAARRRAFMGREALLEERARGPRRRTIGLVATARRSRGSRTSGPCSTPAASRSASRAGRCSRTRSSRTSRSRSSTPPSASDDLVVRAPDGDREARVRPIPFV